MVEIIYLSLHCHHQNDSCIKMGSDENHFNVSLIVRDKVTRQCPQTTIFEEKGERNKRNNNIIVFDIENLSIIIIMRIIINLITSLMTASVSNIIYFQLPIYLFSNFIYFASASTGSVDYGCTTKGDHLLPLWSFRLVPVLCLSAFPLPQ